MLRKVRPSTSYELDLPQESIEQFDPGVASFWIEGNPLALQISSYIRHKEEQVGARERLTDRITKNSVNWKVWKENIHPDSTIDQATAEFTDQNNCVWLHSYLVWPHLAIYVTISGPTVQIKQNNWALQSLKSIRLVVQ